MWWITRAFPSGSVVLGLLNFVQNGMFVRVAQSGRAVFWLHHFVESSSVFLFEEQREKDIRCPHWRLLPSRISSSGSLHILCSSGVLLDCIRSCSAKWPKSKKGQIHFQQKMSQVLDDLLFCKMAQIQMAFGVSNGINPCQIHKLLRALLGQDSWLFRQCCAGLWKGSAALCNDMHNILLKTSCF